MPARRAYFLPLLFLGVLVAAGFSLAIGTIEVDWQQVYQGVVAGRPSLHYEVVMGSRLPRALNAFLVGGMLAVAGALMQVLLRNPLADPYVLGVSGGASVGALLAIMLGWAEAGPRAGRGWADGWAGLGRGWASGARMRGLWLPGLGGGSARGV